MNERIKELLEQAGVKYVKMPNDTVYAKFAELLVRECFDVVINDGRFHDAKGIIRAGKGVAMEHFGVEE
jgi:hypothetical protein